MSPRKSIEARKLAWDTLDLIHENPDRLNMASWLSQADEDEIGQTVVLEDLTVGCGTTACFAGWTVLVAGGQLHEDEWYGTQAQLGGDVDAVPKVAADLLELNSDEAHILFHGEAEYLAANVAQVMGPRP